MLRSFKNLELFRYYVANAIEKNMRVFIKKNEQDSIQLASTVFSTTFSLVASFVSTKYMEDIPTVKNIILIICVFTIGFLSSYFGFTCFLKLFKRIRLSYKKYRHKDEAEYIKQLIDDFDHIACDNVLISKEFILHFLREQKRNDKKAATFAYYESLYYLKAASDKVKRVLDNGENCINNKNTIVTLDIYRVTNLHSMMLDVFEFIEANRNRIIIENELSRELDRQINLVDTTLKDIKTLSDKFIYNFNFEN